ncbi:hypothetical protein [Prevotella sp.]|uniref:hypothetical protein n=1 Tax=Prevotella sp. TaxID=59823 RepID=UPI0025DCEB45|nr:hypothetical protein [Prevotella sp.]
MDKYITSLKDLIAETFRNSFKLNESAKKGDSKACFQMGMVYLLGINTAIDFKKAKLQFSSQSLLNDHDAQRMLGFLSELDGDYSAAFMYYAKAAGGVVDGSDDSYIENVKQERETLRGWLNKWNFPVRVLNNAITTILEDYAKGGEKKEKACIEIAAICQDAVSCITVARILMGFGDYSDAMQWLQYGAVEKNNPMYQMIQSKIYENSRFINLSNVLEIIEIDGCSLLSNIDIAANFAPARNALNGISVRCSKLWRKEVMPKIESIKSIWKKEEKNRIKKEEEDRQRALKQAELLELEEKIRKKKRRDKIINIILSILFLPYVWIGVSANMDFVSTFLVLMLFALPFLAVRWIVIKVLDYFNK